MQRASSSTSGTPASESASFVVCSPATFAPPSKCQNPDMLSALERYLDDMDARLQLERELMDGTGDAMDETW